MGHHSGRPQREYQESKVKESRVKRVNSRRVKESKLRESKTKESKIKKSIIKSQRVNESIKARWLGSLAGVIGGNSPRRPCCPVSLKTTKLRVQDICPVTSIFRSQASQSTKTSNLQSQPSNRKPQTSNLQISILKSQAYILKNLKFHISNLQSWTK